MSIIQQWASDWGLPPDALADLKARLAPPPPGTLGPPLSSEAAALNAVRLEAGLRGWRLFRNNVGAMQDKTGRVVRYGLANESKQMSAVVKSADLIGLTDHGVFVSIECKSPGARTDPERLAAQERWRDLVISCGGIGLIVSDPSELP